MSYTRLEIKQKIGGKLIGKKPIQDLVAEALTFLPDDLIDDITKTVWFISSPDDAWGFTLRGDELKGKHLVFLSEELMTESKQQAFYTILHEVGHVTLNHKNAILAPQTKAETEKQEMEADQFARKYL